MKTKIAFVLALLIGSICLAQNGINYKAVIKDGSGNIVANTLIEVQFTISEVAAIVYRETHSPTTDANGIIIVNIGEGTPITGTFGTIDWSSMNHFLSVLVDTGSGLQDMGITAFKTVPYALTSADAVFKTSGANGYKTTGNIGIGTSSPVKRLHINDAVDASILLQTPVINNISSLRLENGNVAGTHTFFKLENRNDALHIGVDTDLAVGTGYVDVVTISAGGNIVTQGSLRLGIGTIVNEFSTDGTLAGNSNFAVPTEAAVKTYVDNNVGSSTETIVIPASAFNSTSTSFSLGIGALANATSGSGRIFAPLHIPLGATITSITAHFQDYDAVRDLTISLFRAYQGSNIPSSVWSGSTIGSGGWQQVSSGTVSFLINNDYQYYFTAIPTTTWGPSDFGVTLVKITYTK